MYVNLLVHLVLFLPDLSLLALRFLSWSARLRFEKRDFVLPTARCKIVLEVGPNEDFIVYGESLACHKVFSGVAIDRVCRRVGDVRKQHR
ncbi:hypothetical protein BJ912DRAFT_989173 [Pholiota molesta]|nr:hypothetical protein BJ912DRAFT_989173 [Pholiota molesta]